MNFAGFFPKVSPAVHLIAAALGEGGVHIFFVISGFIITTLLLREAKTKGGVSLTFFYRRRFFRIVPPYAVYLIVLFLLCQLGYIYVKPINFLWSSFFLGNLGLFGKIGPSNWFVSHTWSLSVEEQYYLILPPIMVLVFRLRRKPINILLIGLFVLCMVANKLAKEASAHIHPSLISLTALYSFRYIIVGVMLALHKDFVIKTLVKKSLLIPVSLIGILLALPFAGHVPATVSLLFASIEAMSYGVLVLWFVENPEKCGMLRWGWVQWVGSCSYSIYLWQQLFTAAPDAYKGWTIAQSPFAIVAILTCSALSYYFIELPSIRLSRSFTQKFGQGLH